MDHVRMWLITSIRTTNYC